MKTPMPLVDVEALRDHLSPEDLALVEKTVNLRGPDKGRLRATCPPPRHEVIRAEDGGLAWRVRQEDAQAAYLWRWLVFTVSDRPEHQQVPCQSDYWLEGDALERRQVRERLDAIWTCVVERAVYVEQDGGVRQFARPR